MQTIEVNGIGVAFADEGEGQTVILLHSSTGSRWQWRDAFDAWSGRFRMIAPDLLGYGGTEPFGGLQHSLRDEVEITAAMIARADRPVHLVGHSYGGAVALQTALEMGPRIASLSLLEPTAFYLLAQAPAAEDEAPGGLAEITEVVRDIEDASAAGFPLAAARRFIDYWCGQGAWILLPLGRKWQISSQMEKVRQDFYALLREETALAQVAALKIPTLVLCGSNSPNSTRCLSRIVATAIPGSRHRTIANAGHMLAITHSETVNGFILEHMENADRRRSVREPSIAAHTASDAAGTVPIGSLPSREDGHYRVQA